MINHSDILTAIKILFDADATLNTLLGRKSDSKVFTGIMPDSFGYPAVQIVIMTDNQIDTTHDLSEVTFLVNAHTQNDSTGRSQLKQSSDIINRCNDLIDDISLTVSGHRIFTMYVESRNPVINDPSNPKHSIEGIRCRMFAAK